MYFVALATDYDGTLASEGGVEPALIEALVELKSSGRRLILLTGRLLADLIRAFPQVDLFDLVVAENGALLFDPKSKEETLLADPPPPEFLRHLRDMAVVPLEVGRVIVATRQPHERIVLEAIRDLGLDLQIIFNKGAVMVLPSNVNKASGMSHALAHLGLAAHNVVGIGDAENDLAFLSASGCAVAVGNALPSVKAQADFAVADAGAGVVELIQLIIEDDLLSQRHTILREQPLLGVGADGNPLRLSPLDTLLVCGASGAGKSTTVTALIEQMNELRFQFCVVDPEGDYDELAGAVVIGDSKRAPRIAEILELLEKPEVDVVVNLMAIGTADRPEFFAGLLPDLAKLRSRTGRPHWLIIDEVHHCLPVGWKPAPLTMPKQLPSVIAITVSLDAVSRDFLELVSTAVCIGDAAGEAIAEFCEVFGCAVPPLPRSEPNQMHVLTRAGTYHVVSRMAPKLKQQRHARKYAEGELGEDKSFYFRGPNGVLNLRARNLNRFVELAEGIDDETWVHHLRAGEYSRWFRDAIKDQDLADEAYSVEADVSATPQTSRQRMKEIIERRYTAPAEHG